MIDTSEAMHRLDALIATAPGETAEMQAPSVESRDLPDYTGVPARCLLKWDRPTDAVWVERFECAKRMILAGGLMVLTGTRGTGKTRLASELIRDLEPRWGLYTTAMALFLQLRDSYRKDSEKSESEIVQKMSTRKLLVVDEIQERSSSDWEDRVLTHIIDARYGAQLPTVIIANLKPSELAAQLGPSISDRMRECGGVLEMTGPSHRKGAKP